MRSLTPALAPAGYSPARLNPLSPAPVADQGQRLTDLKAIQRLFANGEQGGYWPADPAYLYEDSAGTIQASVNGVVGLWLDAIASPIDVILNGSNFTAWGPGIFGNHIKPTVSSNSAISPIGDNTADVLTSTHASASTVGSNVVATSAGRKYTLMCYIRSTAITTASLHISFGTSPTTYLSNVAKSISITSSWALYEFSAIVPASATYVQGNISFNVNLIGSTMDVWGAQLFDNRNAAIQATTANKPYLRKTPVSNKFWLDSNTSTGALTATFASSLGSACTIATVGAEGVTIADNQTVGTTYNLTPPYGYNGDVIIINRALTETEKALVKRVMGRSVPLLGSELVTNGRFENGTEGWTESAVGSAEISVVSGRLRLAPLVTGINANIVTSPVNTAPGQRYKLSIGYGYKTIYNLFGFNLSNNGYGTGAFFSTSFGNFGVSSIANINIMVAPTAATTYIVLRTDNSIGLTVVGDYTDFDDISFRAIL